MSQPPSASEASDSIHRLISDICAADYSFDCPRRFSAYAQRLHLVLAQLLRASPSPDTAPASVQTALKGISAHLHNAASETLAVYRNKSKIFVLINCHTLSASLHDSAVAIGGWLALMDSALHDHPDLHKNIADLSRDMKHSHFEVSENEARVYCTLQREGQGRQTSKAVQSAIVMDLARALGIDVDNHFEISEQIKLLKNDLSSSSSVLERRILISLEGILDNWSVEPSIVTLSWDLSFEEDAQITPFKNFLCPLTKEVMKEPVVLESSQQTYERTAIEYWFQRCIEDGRDPTCPVTGQMLKSLEQKPNIGLAGAIDEWVSRNVEIQVKVAVQYLSEDPLSMDCIERVLDNIYKISEEHPSNRYKVRNANVVVLIVKLLRNSSKIIGTHLRSKALMALLTMSKDEESKKIMLEEGITRLAIRSLIGSSEKEKESAVKLLLEFCSDEAYCIKTASEKGALVLLSSMAGDLEHPSLSNLAEEVLKQMEKVEDIIEDLAAAGRFEPLLSRLCNGSDDAKIKMACMVGRMTLTNSSKEQIARESARILVDLLFKPEGKAASLQALHSLSELDDNVTILVNSGVLPAVTDILFGTHGTPPQLKELAASTIANIVTNPGHWELASVDKEGHPVQSESFVLHLLGLLSFTSSQCQMHILHILCGVASSPQATESVASHIVSGDGVRTIVPFLDHPEVEHRIYAFRLMRLISERFGEDLARVLKSSDKLPVFKNKLLDNQSTDDERSDSACILANLSFSEDEVKGFLGAGFVRWIVTTLKDQHHISTQLSSSMVEGLIGLLLHFTRRHDPETLSAVREHHLMTIFCEQLGCPSPRSKQLAAIGLKNLSESGRAHSSGISERQPPNGFCSVFMCWRAAPCRSTCPVHNIPCGEGSQFCLIKSHCIKPVLDLLKVKDTDVQIAAMEALSTLIFDTSSDFKRAVDELEQLGVIDAVIHLFTEVRPGELQEKAIWIIEKVVRVEGQTRYSLNQSLVRALVEAFKYGNANTKRHAQDALTSLKQISGVSGKTSNQTRGRR